MPFEVRGQNPLDYWLCPVHGIYKRVGVECGSCKAEMPTSAWSTGGGSGGPSGGGGSGSLNTTDIANMTMNAYRSWRNGYAEGSYAEGNYIICEPAKPWWETCPPTQPIYLKPLNHRGYRKQYLDSGDSADLAKALAVLTTMSDSDIEVMQKQNTIEWQKDELEWAQKHDCGRDRRRVRVARICPCKACQKFVTDAEANRWSRWDSLPNEFQNKAMAGAMVSALLGLADFIGMSMAFGIGLWLIPSLIYMTLATSVVIFAAWRMP